MELSEAIESAEKELPRLLHLNLSGVTSASKKEDGWHVTIEMVERHALPDSQDLLGVYDIILDDRGKLMNYERKRVRRRNEVEEMSEYE
jgi:hypothetical protein